jgi:hypothetical protein
VTVVQQMRVDKWTAEVTREMRHRGLRPLLLKGPATIALLYEDARELHPYADADLYVTHTEHADARAVLHSLGFSSTLVLLAVDENHATMYKRDSDGAYVDLHRSLHGLEDVAPERVWQVLSRRTETLTVAGLPVEAPDRTVRLLNIALHVSPADDHWSLPWQDLDRALRVCDDRAWSAAVALAAELGIEDELAPRLRRHPRGASIADSLGLANVASERYTLARALDARVADESVLSIAYMAGLASWSDRVKYVLVKLFPPRSYLEARWPPARRGLAGLVVVRVARVLACAAGFPRALWQWHRHRRSPQG